jgi:hypothetical protein
MNSSNSNNADDAAGTEDADPPVMAVTSVHLNARSEERRVRQLRACLEAPLSAFSNCYAPRYVPPCAIIAGNFNSKLFDGSCVAAFLKLGPPRGGGEQGGKCK